METFQYNDATKLGFKWTPIYASSNAITGTKFVTEIYLIQGSNQYPLGQFDGKLLEEDISFRFGEIIKQGQERSYGQQETVLRKNLQSRRDRGRTGSQGQQSLHRGLGDISKLNR